MDAPFATTVPAPSPRERRRDGARFVRFSHSAVEAASLGARISHSAASGARRVLRNSHPSRYERGRRSR
jgi:hypothetical protein